MNCIFNLKKINKIKILIKNKNKNKTCKKFCFYYIKKIENKLYIYISIINGMDLLLV